LISKYDQEYFESPSYQYSQRKKEVAANFLRDFSYVSTNYVDIRDGKGKISLDVGCAYGYILRVLQKFGYKTFGTDVSMHALKIAGKIAGKDSVLILHDAKKPFPFKMNFDLLTCFEVLEHLKEPELAIKNCFEALKPKGVFLASTPNKRTPLAHFFDKDYTHLSLKYPWQWRKALKKFNWSMVKMFFVERNGRIHRLPVYGSIRLFAQKR